MDYPVQRTSISYCKHEGLGQIKKNLSKIATTKVRICNKVEKHSERVRGTRFDVNFILLWWLPEKLNVSSLITSLFHNIVSCILDVLAVNLNHYFAIKSFEFKLMYSVYLFNVANINNCQIQFKTVISNNSATPITKFSQFKQLQLIYMLIQVCLWLDVMLINILV